MASLVAAVDCRLRPWLVACVDVACGCEASPAFALCARVRPTMIFGVESFSNGSCPSFGGRHIHVVLIAADAEADCGRLLELSNKWPHLAAAPACHVDAPSPLARRSLVPDTTAGLNSEVATAVLATLEEVTAGPQGSVAVDSIRVHETSPSRLYLTGAHEPPTR